MSNEQMTITLSPETAMQLMAECQTKQVVLHYEGKPVLVVIRHQLWERIKEALEETPCTT